jgi:hypothetical protein
MSWGESAFVYDYRLRAYTKICHQSRHAWYSYIASMALGSLDEEGKALYPYHCGELPPTSTCILLNP